MQLIVWDMQRGLKDIWRKAKTRGKWDPQVYDR